MREKEDTPKKKELERKERERVIKLIERHREFLEAVGRL